MQPAHLIIFFLSGVCALGYQLSWVKLFATGLGHELPATLAVVTAFFGGLALGARLLDRIGSSAQPARWYLALEIIILLWACFTLALIEPTLEIVHMILGAEAAPGLYWFIAFLGTFLILLPATIAMGGTLAAAENWYRQVTASRDQIGVVYLINTVGAAVGSMLVPFVLMPKYGLIVAFEILLALNLLVVFGAILLNIKPRESSSQSLNQARVKVIGHDPALATRLFLAGFLGIGFEVLGVRVMAQIFEGTVYSFSATLCIFLLGSAIGGLLYHFLQARWVAKQWLAYCTLGLSFSVLFGVGVLSHAQGLYRAARGFFGDEPSGVLAAELSLALPIYAPACILMGALFCHLTAQARTNTGGIGWALSANTLGGMISPALIALLVIPNLGLKWTGVTLAFGYLLLLPQPSTMPRWVALLPLLAAGLLPAEIQVVTLREGERVIAYDDGSVASVAVTERRSERNLRVNNRFQMGGTGAAALRVQRMQAHLPLLLHPAPRRALFLGVATGITSGAALRHSGLSVDAVELTPGVLDVLSRFEYFNHGLASSNRAQLYNADARRFVRMSDVQYDVIVGDLFQPARDGAGFLYTVEHFRAVRERLAENGIYCQWLPLYQMDEEIVRIIIRTFVESFPHVEAWLGSFDVKHPVLALLGQRSRREFNLDQLEVGMNIPAVQQDLARAAIRSPVQFFGHYLADDKRLRKFAHGAAINTDDIPVVLFEAPKFTFQRHRPGYESLQALLKAFEPAGEVLMESPDTLAARIQGFRRARQDFFRGVIALAEGRRERGIEYLFRALEKSVDFTLAYAQLVSVARQLGESESKEGERILVRLARFYPDVTKGRSR